MLHQKRSHPGISLSVAIVLMLSAAVSAHERQVIGQYRLTIGWGDEPAFTGSRNFVSVAVSDLAGTPVADLGGALRWRSFGDERRTLPPDRPSTAGRLRAWLMPTRSGTYLPHHRR